ncbi:hypothetical protein ACRAWF_25135 [Streptomyces sp. L7]
MAALFEGTQVLARPRRRRDRCRVGAEDVVRLVPEVGAGTGRRLARARREPRRGGRTPPWRQAR